jgi:hypothetical protein
MSEGRTPLGRPPLTRTRLIISVISELVAGTIGGFVVGGMGLIIVGMMLPRRDFVEPSGQFLPDVLTFLVGSIPMLAQILVLTPLGAAAGVYLAGRFMSVIAPSRSVLIGSFSGVPIALLIWIGLSIILSIDTAMPDVIFNIALFASVLMFLPSPIASTIAYTRAARALAPESKTL